MKKKAMSICFITCFIVMLIACVPQSVQLKGTWEFVGYKDGRIKSVIETDSTICFDGDGNGYYYQNDDTSISNYFTYLISNDHKLVIIIDEKNSVVEYSIDSKTKRLTLDGLEYRLVSPNVEIPEKEAEKTAVAVSTDMAVPTVSPVSNDTETASPTMMKTMLKVGASVTPHAEILREAGKLLEKQGITLEIVEYTDYIQPNTAVEDGSLDANYFQHVPYLNTFNAENRTRLVSVGSIHYEPFGIYAGKVKSLADLPNGANIGVPNDSSNETRALLLLQQEGIIKLKDGIDAASHATKLDIVENPKNINIIELEAAQIPKALPDLDLGVINGNYALQAGFNVGKDALAVEDASSSGAQTYANVLCVKEGHEKDGAILALFNALTSEEVRTFINSTYSGAVVPITDVPGQLSNAKSIPNVVLPKPIILTVVSDIDKLLADKNNKVIVTGTTAPSATLTATPTAGYQSSIVCDSPIVDANGNYSFEVTFDNSYYGIASITIHAKIDGYEENEATCLVGRMYADRQEAIKSFSKARSYHEVPSGYAFDQVKANPIDSGFYRFTGKIVEVDSKAGIISFEAKASTTEVISIYVLNAVANWDATKNVGKPFKLYCTLNGLYADGNTLYVTAWFVVND